MITTLEKIIKSNGYKFLKKYEVDKLVGDSTKQSHITAVVFVDTTTMLVWCDAYSFALNIEGTKFQRFKQKEYAETRYFSPESEISWADTDDELMNDYQYLLNKETIEEDRRRDECLTYLRKFCDSYDSLKNYFKIDEIIKENKGGQFDAIFENDCDWGKSLVVSAADVNRIITRIYTTGYADIIDVNDNNITKTLNIREAVAIYPCLCNGKDCIVIKMAGDKPYYLMRDKCPCTYAALCVLYGFDDE